MILEQEYNEALANINNRVELQKSKYNAILEQKTKQARFNQLVLMKKRLIQRLQYLKEAKDPKNDYAIQQYSIQIQQVKLWIIAEQKK